MRFLELDKEALLEYVKTQEQKETILNAFLAVYTGGVPTRRMIGNINNSIISSHDKLVYIEYYYTVISQHNIHVCTFF